MKFSDSAGNTIVFELETTERDSNKETILRKLGDGNFGCVFAASGGQHELALKVIYEHQASSHASDGGIDYKEMRTVNELRVKEIIFDRLRQSHDKEIRKLVPIYDKHLVLPLAYSTKLNEDKEFQKYASVYKKYDMAFSKYAYVMKRFDCSLKDLMEHGGQVSADVTDRRRTAYDQLKSVPLLERERSALPVISQVTQGLRVLHAAGLRHQDIKPANIYFRDDVGTAEFVLGDLGFLYEQNPIAAGSAMASADALVIGTKHYRSIEQIDHSDVSEVIVERGEKDGTATVVSRDPKFLRTNIRAGDMVVFPRSSSRTLFKIVEFVVRDAEQNEAFPYVRMVIESHREPDGHERRDEGLLSLSDGLTQASFVKNPTERTDLFGLGAVLFDIISAGESAERFYELLRKFDVRNKSILQAILNVYPTWKSGQAVAPDISAIFQRLSGDGRWYLHPGMMAFLLKCMMSEPEDSFYNMHFAPGKYNKLSEQKKRDGQKDGPQDMIGWPAVSASIDALMRELGAQDYHSVDKNALTAERPPPVVDSSPPSHEAISVLLPSLQKQEPIERWLRAASLLNAMMELTRRTTNKIRSPKYQTAFISLKPEHLVLSRDDQIIRESDVVGHYTYHEYLAQLMVLDPLFSSLNSDPISFLPIWWPSRLRSVNVRLWQSDGADPTTASSAAIETDGLLRVTYNSTDCTMPGQQVQPGDFLVVSNDESTHSLYDVKEVLEGCIAIRKNETVEEERKNSEVKFAVNEDRGGYLVKAIDACSYYGGMLAVYMFYALFAGGGKTGVEHLGRAVISKSLYFPMSSLTKPSEKQKGGNREWLFSQKKPATGQHLIHYAIRLYVWLMLGGFHGDQNQMESIRSEVSKWKDDVADTLNKRRDDVDPLIFQYSEEGEITGNQGRSDELRDSLQIDEATWEEVARSYIGSR